MTPFTRLPATARAMPAKKLPQLPSQEIPGVTRTLGRRLDLWFISVTRRLAHQTERAGLRTHNVRPPIEKGWKSSPGNLQARRTPATLTIASSGPAGRYDRES